MSYERTSYEKETVINYNQEEKTALVYTYDKPLIRKLRKLVGERDDVTMKYGDDSCATFVVPKKWIKVSPPKNMNLSEEQRAAVAERMRIARGR